MYDVSRADYISYFVSYDQFTILTLQTSLSEKWRQNCVMHFCILVELTKLDAFA